jgi:hypothetical protein
MNGFHMVGVCSCDDSVLYCLIVDIDCSTWAIRHVRITVYVDQAQDKILLVFPFFLSTHQIAPPQNILFANFKLHVLYIVFISHRKHKLPYFIALRMLVTICLPTYICTYSVSGCR